MVRKNGKNGEEKEMPMVIDKEPKNLTVMADIRRIAKQAMKEKGLTFEDVKKKLGIKRYEK